jgi:hypothetical protein
LSGSGLKLTYGGSRNGVVGRTLVCRLSIRRLLVLVVLMLVMCGLRIDIRRYAMTLCRRGVGIAMLFVMGVLIMLSRLLIGHRMIDRSLLLMRRLVVRE